MDASPMIAFRLFLSVFLVSAVQAQGVSALYQGADLKMGESLISKYQCDSCHQEKFGGDGSAIYRPKGRVNSLSALRGMVESCDQALNVGLFPEEVNSISAVLNRDHYRFK
jgi:hypothetical protein